MGSVVLPHLVTGWHVDQAIMSEEERLVIIRFGRDWDPECMRQDEVLYRIADRVKNFAVIYETPEREIRLAPAYDIVSTTPYIPRDTLALTLNDSKSFPARTQLIKFMRLVTSRTQTGVLELLDRVAYGVSISIAEATAYGRRHADARSFADRLIGVMTRGLDRLGLEPVPVRASQELLM